MCSKKVRAQSSSEELALAILVDCYCAIVPRAEAEHCAAGANDKFVEQVRANLEQDTQPLDAVDIQLILTDIELKAYGPTILERMGVGY